jgi:hypothetical protein
MKKDSTLILYPLSTNLWVLEFLGSTLCPDVSAFPLWCGFV